MNAPQMAGGECPKHGMLGLYGGEMKDGKYRPFCSLCDSEREAMTPRPPSGLSAALERAFDAGRQARRENEQYTNPHPRGSAEERKFYEGWCHQNMIFFTWRLRP